MAFILSYRYITASHSGPPGGVLRYFSDREVQMRPHFSNPKSPITFLKRSPKKSNYSKHENHIKVQKTKRMQDINFNTSTSKKVLAKFFLCIKNSPPENFLPKKSQATNFKPPKKSPHLPVTNILETPSPPPGSGPTLDLWYSCCSNHYL